MELITQRSLIREVAKAWRQQYPAHGHWGKDTEKQDIARKLALLDPETATAEVVNALIGNKSWTRVPECDECGVLPDAVVQIGEPLDVESRTAHICLDCIKQARRLFREAA